MAKKKIIEAEEVQAVEVNEEVNTTVEDIPDAPPEDTSDEINEEIKMNFVEDLGFAVKEILNSEEIEAIASFVNQYTSWTDRFYAKAVITLNTATDLNEEEITNIITNVDMIVHPFVLAIYENILNWDFVEQAIAYYDSASYKLTNFMNNFEEVAKKINEEVEKAAEENITK